MLTTTTTHLGAAKTMLAALAGNITKALESAGGSLQDKLALAVQAERELSDASRAISEHLNTARSVAADRAFALHAEIREAAIAQVVRLLNEGTLTLEALAARMNKPAGLPASPVQASEAAPISAEAHAAPTVSLAPAPSKASMSASARENLRVQGGYLNKLKFFDPTTGLGWSGRGPMPQWLKDLAANGRSVEEFRVAQEPAVETPAAAPAATPTAPVAEAPAVEAATPAALAAPTDSMEPAEAPIAQAADSDIGEEVASFDAENLGDDIGAPTGGDDDIGEIVEGIAAMGDLNLPANSASFLVVA